MPLIIALERCSYSTALRTASTAHFAFVSSHMWLCVRFTQTAHDKNWGTVASRNTSLQTPASVLRASFRAPLPNRYPAPPRPALPQRPGLPRARPPPAGAWRHPPPTERPRWAQHRDGRVQGRGRRTHLHQRSAAAPPPPGVGKAGPGRAHAPLAGEGDMAVPGLGRPARRGWDVV